MLCNIIFQKILCGLYPGPVSRSIPCGSMCGSMWPVSRSRDHLFPENGIGELDYMPKYLRTEFSAVPTSMLLDLGQTGDVCVQHAARCWDCWVVVSFLSNRRFLDIRQA